MKLKVLFYIPTYIVFLAIFFFYFNNNIKQVRYDKKCKEKIKFVLTENYKVARLHSEFDIDLSKLEEFSHRYYLFEQFMHYMRYLEYKTEPHPLISDYVNGIKNNIKIEDVILTKIVPKNQKSFLEKEYRNFTMGGTKMLQDLDKDKIPEIISSTTSGRCTKNVKSYYFNTKDIEVNKNRNFIEDIAIEVTDEDRLYEATTIPNIENYYKKIHLHLLIYIKEIQKVFNFNGKIINQNEIHLK